jgi:enoyl-CoA hydratase/carnithine racemase
VGEFVKLEVEGGVGTIRLDRPPMNAINDQLRTELAEAALAATARADVRAVVIYGGQKVFAAGADIKQMVTASYGEMVERAGALQSALELLARIPKPTVAAVTGYALGGGCELALTADFRVCGDNAKLGQPEILLGVIPGAGGTQRLARLIGPARTKDLVYSGRFVDAEEALRIGLVDKVVAPDDVYSAAVELASKYVEGPALALRAAKAAIDGGLDVDLDSGLRLETQLFTGLFATEDQTIGMQSFVENGPGKAKFTGK